MDEVRYMISEAAKKLQVESHVLRYWEEELGLEIGRTDMGHRYYTEDDIQLFLCIQKLKNEGMLLRDLKFMIPELTATRKRLNAAKKEKGTDAAGQTNAAKQGKGTDAAEQTNGERQGKGADAAEQMNTAKQEKELCSVEKTMKKAAAEPLGKTVSATGAQTDPTPESNPPAESNTVAEGASETENVSLASTSPAPPEADVIQVTQLEQVRSLIGDVLTDVVSANNETLKKDISRKVTTDVIREMDFLFQANERREEEHYRKLDVLIRQQQAGRREAARSTPLGKLKKLLT